MVFRNIAALGVLNVPCCVQPEGDAPACAAPDLRLAGPVRMKLNHVARHGDIPMTKPKSKNVVFKVGRDAGSGKFIPVKKAERRKKTAIVETIKRPRKPKDS